MRRFGRGKVWLLVGVSWTLRFGQIPIDQSDQAPPIEVVCKLFDKLAEPFAGDLFLPWKG